MRTVPCPLIATQALVLLLLVSPIEGGQSPTSIRVSPDVSITLAMEAFDDKSVIEDDLLGSVSSVPIGTVPSPADVAGYAFAEDPAAHLFSLDVSITLPGIPILTPGDVGRFQGGVFTIAFQGALHGIPPGTSIDAIALHGEDLLLSFDTTIALDPGFAEDEDLVLADAAGLTLFLDGSASGIDSSLDLDAAHNVASNGHLLVSFDTSGAIAGVSFNDEDVLEYDPLTGTWLLSFDATSLYAEWAAVDMDAFHAAFSTGVIFADGFESGDTSEWSAIVQ